MKLLHVLAGASLAMLLGPVTSLAGSYPQKHHGFFFGFNAGGGVASVRYTATGETDRQPGGAMNIRIGGSVANNVLLGAELTGWAREQNGQPIGIGSALFALTYFPTGGLFIRGGSGFGTTQFLEKAPDGSVGLTGEVGVAFGGAAGYEWRLSRRFALGYQMEFNWINVGGELVDKASYADASLCFNWYP
jgi:hypothetical protein